MSMFLTGDRSLFHPVCVVLLYMPGPFLCLSRWFQSKQATLSWGLLPAAARVAVWHRVGVCC